MRAFVIERPGVYGVRDVAAPVLGPDEVLIAPTAVGLCAADVDLANGHRDSRFASYPIVAGHEWSGRVVAVGPGVDGVRLGAPVVAESVRSCGRCERCREGRDNLCASGYAETGYTHAGGLAELVTVPARLVHVLPERIGLASAALVEPAARVVSALLEIGGVPAGCRLGIVGDGPLAELARQIVALVSPVEVDIVPAGAVGVAVDLVVEMTGTASGAHTALSMGRRGGTVLLLGSSPTGAALDPDAISLGQLRVQGGFTASPEAWRRTVGLLVAGLIDLGPLVTHEFELDGVDAALRLLAEEGESRVKPLIRVSE